MGEIKKMTTLINRLPIVSVKNTILQFTQSGKLRLNIKVLLTLPATNYLSIPKK